MHSVEYLGKCRRLIYLKSDGSVQGKHSGGGAVESLHGAELIVAVFDDVEAPLKFGCVEAYFNPVGTPIPVSVNLLSVGDFETKAVGYLEELKKHDVRPPFGECPQCTEAFDALSDARDECVTNYVAPVMEE